MLKLSCCYNRICYLTWNPIFPILRAWKYFPPGIFEFPKGYIFFSESFILVAKFAEKNPIEAQLYWETSLILITLSFHSLFLFIFFVLFSWLYVFIDMYWSIFIYVVDTYFVLLKTYNIQYLIKILHWIPHVIPLCKCFL